jgi:predicted nucleic acid-binding protein
VIIDTSVWIEYFRGNDSTAGRWVAERIEAGSALVVPEVVLMELLIGTTEEQTASLWRRFLLRFTIEPLAPIRDSENAAEIHRRCRRAGNTVRSLIDCQVAAIALRLDLEIAHRDWDFDVIATNCGVRTLALY